MLKCSEVTPSEHPNLLSLLKQKLYWNPQLNVLSAIPLRNLAVMEENWSEALGLNMAPVQVYQKT